jgi:hypothetical protein
VAYSFYLNCNLEVGIYNFGFNIVVVNTSKVISFSGSGSGDDYYFTGINSSGYSIFVLVLFMIYAFLFIIFGFYI